MPKIHAETAIKQNPGLVSIIDSMIVPEMSVLSAEQQDRLNAAIEGAKDAVADHQTWLEEELLPRAAVGEAIQIFAADTHFEGRIRSLSRSRFRLAIHRAI